MTTKIEWVARPGTMPETWNLVGGCTKKSPGCANCYAIRQSWMKMHHPNPKVRELYEGTVHKVNGRLEWTGRINLASSERLEKPLRWRKARTIFVCSMADLFHDDVPFDYITSIFGVMHDAPQHTFMVLTKRPKRMGKFFDWLGYNRGGDCPANVWGMVSVENQAAADERIPLLLQTPFAVRGVSCEPLLERVELFDRYFLGAYREAEVVTEFDGDRMWYKRPGRGIVKHDGASVNWLIAGGESGPGARPMHPDWARGLRDQCQAADVPFFFKQHGAYVDISNMPQETIDKVVPVSASRWAHMPDGTRMHRVDKKAAGRLLDGCEWNEWPGQENSP